MHKLPLFRLLLLVISCCIACKQSPTIEQIAPSLKVGETLKYKSSIFNDTKAGAEGEEVQSTMDEQDYYRFYVKEETETGNILVDFFIDTVYLKMTSSMKGIPMMEPFIVDSRNKEKAENPAVEILQELIKGGNLIEYDEKGDILNFIGLDERLDSIMTATAAPEIKQIIAQVGMSFNSTNMKTHISSLSNFFPENAVQIGDSWKDDLKTKVANMETTIKRTYTLKERSNGQAILDLKGTVLVNPEAELSMNNMKVSYDVSGTLTGRIIVDEKNGWAIVSDLEQIMSGEMTMSGLQVGGEQTINFYSAINSLMERQ